MLAVVVIALSCILGFSSDDSDNQDWQAGRYSYPTQAAPSNPSQTDLRTRRRQRRYGSMDHRMTPCLQEIGLDNESGRYPRLIANEFLSNMVIAKDPAKNLFCHCEAYDLMVCFIVVRRGSLQAQAVEMRLERGDPNRLRPFFIAPQLHPSDEPPIYYEYSLCSPAVYADIRIEYNDEHSPLLEDVPLPLMRANSAPSLPQLESAFSGLSSRNTDAASAPSRQNYKERKRRVSSPDRFHYPVLNIPLGQCGSEGSSNTVVCPITQDDLSGFDIVYILKADRQKVKNGDCVVCISAGGLRKLASSVAGDAFIDPLRREGENQEKLLTIDDYDAYIISEELPSRNADGSCPDEQSTLDPFANMGSWSRFVLSLRNNAPSEEERVSSSAFTMNYLFTFILFIFTSAFTFNHFFFRRQYYIIEDANVELI